MNLSRDISYKGLAQSIHGALPTSRNVWIFALMKWQSQSAPKDILRIFLTFNRHAHTLAANGFNWTKQTDADLPASASKIQMYVCAYISPNSMWIGKVSIGAAK